MMEWTVYCTYPLRLAILACVIVIIAFLRARYYVGVVYRYPVASHLVFHSYKNRSFRSVALFLIRCVLLGTLAVLISKPQWIDLRSYQEVEGVDIVIALDVSGSMTLPNSKDDTQRRIDVAKAEATRFIRKRTHDALGLVLFGEDAISRCPLTSDKRVLLDMVSHVDLGAVPHEGTVITKALLTAINRLRYSKAKSKIIILLTDGEPSQHDLEPQIAIQAAQQLGIKIYTVGIGDNQDLQVTHPFYGQVLVASRVNEVLLTKLAVDTGGQFFMAQKPDDMRRIYDTIDTLEKTRIQTPLFTRSHDWFIPLIWCALANIVLELCLTSSLWFGL